MKKAVALSLFFLVFYSLNCLAADTKSCATVAADIVAKSFLDLEFNGWRNPNEVQESCGKTLTNINLFQEFGEKKPKIIYVDASSLNITQLKLTDLKNQKYIASFTVKDSDGKTHSDKIIFEKTQNGKLSAKNHCALLLFAPAKAVYVSKKCKK